MKKIFILLVMLYTLCLHAEWFDRFFQRANSFTVFVDAAGDATQGGRIIDNNYESSINFTIAQSLKNALATSHPHLKIVLNRTPLETIAPLQNAQFANKLGVDLYIHICSVQSPQTSSITLYQFSSDQKTILKKGSLGFFPYDQIYLMHEHQTTEWAHSIKKNLIDQHHSTISGVYKMPFKPLVGINAPALAIEVGIQSLDDLDPLIEQLARALSSFLSKV